MQLGVKAGITAESAKKNAVEALTEHWLEGKKGAKVRRLFKNYSGEYQGTVIGWDYETGRYKIEWDDGSIAQRFWMTSDDLQKYRVSE